MHALRRDSLVCVRAGLLLTLISQADKPTGKNGFNFLASSLFHLLPLLLLCVSDAPFEAAQNSEESEREGGMIIRIRNHGRGMVDD